MKKKSKKQRKDRREDYRIALYILGFVGLVFFTGFSLGKSISDDEVIDEILVTWVHEEKEVLVELKKRELRYAKQGYDVDVGGAATPDYQNRECVIYAFRADDEDDWRALDTIGHELTHCFVDNFHPTVQEENED